MTVLLENDTRGRVRLPALHIAAKKDDVKSASLLLQRDHDVDGQSKVRRHLLIFSASTPFRSRVFKTSHVTHAPTVSERRSC